MRDKFITKDFEIDLSGVKTNFTEENPRFKDSIWTKYTLPVKINFDRNFLSKVGQYSSFTNINLPREHFGYHIFEGQMLRGKINFSDFGKTSAEIQIESGFDELPNFELPLKDLPLDVISVEDIYDHANDIVRLSYPDTNYNFPKLYTDYFNLESEGWKYFDSFINNRIQPSGGLSKKFPRNEIKENEGGWDCINRNIIQPLPYLLYVLKVGFLDAGFILKGDILSDDLLLNRVIYSSNKYYNTADQQYHKTNVYASEYFDNIGNTAKWLKKFVIDAPGKYRLIGSCFNDFKADCYLTIKRNNQIIFSAGSGNVGSYFSFDHVIEVGIDEALEKQSITFEYSGATFNNQFSSSDGVNIGVANIKINPIRQNTQSGDPIPFIFNLNEVNIPRAVPDMTFGELVTVIKNWRNYDIVFDNGSVFMNRIVIDKTKEPEDFRKHEVEEPLRNKNDKRFFNLEFPDIDGVDLESIFYDDSGYVFNKKSIPKNATTISINGFCLPITTFRANTTVKAIKNINALMLVYYAGLDASGDNHAQNPVGLHGVELAEDLKEWYLNRLTNFTFRWSFTASKSDLRKYNIRSDIYAYHKNHYIKSWVKNSLSEDLYHVEIETETF